jgi:tetratricopeptide (TPR) repeat protein
MRFILFSTAICLATLLVISAGGVAAQVVQISGKVTLKQADGITVPIAGAVIDIYRTDIKQKFQVTTDRRGEYLHGGLPMVGTYTIAVSAAGARPDYSAGVRLTRQPVNDFALVRGDGSRLTLEQIAAMGSAPAAPAAPAGESAETRAARERLEHESARIAEENNRITAANEIVARTFKAGNEAVNAGRYDEAIAQYREGLAARPDEPAILTNLSEALRRRGADRHNAAIKDQDSNGKDAGFGAAKKDWSAAAQASRKALDVIKGAPADDPDQQRIYTRNRLAALSAYAQAMRLVATKVDYTQASAAWEAYQEYIAVETDPAKKTRLRGEALQMVFDAGSIDLPIAEARKILATEPNQLDANRVLGLALFASGDKKNYQEAADHLQRYVELAPDTDPLKQSAKESLDYLMTAENIKPRRGQAAQRPPQRRP